MDCFGPDEFSGTRRVIGLLRRDLQGAGASAVWTAIVDRASAGLCGCRRVVLG